MSNSNIGTRVGAVRRCFTSAEGIVYMFGSRSKLRTVNDVKGGLLRKGKLALERPAIGTRNSCKGNEYAKGLLRVR